MSSKTIKGVSLAIIMAALVACGGTATPAGPQGQVQGQGPAGNAAQQPQQPQQPAQGDAAQAQPAQGQAAAQPAQSNTAAQPATGNSSAARGEADVTNLPIGDSFVTESGAQVGYFWSCGMPQGGGGASATGDWYDTVSGTYNLLLKPVVDGSVSWQSQFNMTVQGDTRVFTTNGLPTHTTGNFPIDPSDDAYQYDRNPNSISAQSYSLELPANPTVAAQPNCAAGEVGIAIDGVVINSPLDALSRDAVATEIQDSCYGHPHQGGVYHYHGYTPCIESSGTGHSELVGWALDGFGIYGIYGENGEVLTSSDLDECHGHTHVIDWDGQQVEMFHYHATYTFPYLVGCYRGTAVSFRTGTGGGATTGGAGGTTTGGATTGGPGGQPPSGGGPGGPPPTGGKGG